MPAISDTLSMGEHVFVWFTWLRCDNATKPLRVLAISSKCGDSGLFRSAILLLRMWSPRRRSCGKLPFACSSIVGRLWAKLDARRPQVSSAALCRNCGAISVTYPRNLHQGTRPVTPAYALFLPIRSCRVGRIFFQRSWHRTVLMYVFHWCVALLCTRHIRDTQCGER